MRLPWKVQQTLRFLESVFNRVLSGLLFFPYIMYSLRNRFKSNRKNRPTIVARIEEEDLIGGPEEGRVLYHIFFPFSLSGHNVNYIKRIKFGTYVALKKYGRLVYRIGNLKIINKIPKQTENKILVFDEENEALVGKRWKKMIRIRYDIGSACKSEEKVVVMPYPMSATNYFKYEYHKKLESFRANKKKTKVFFSGDVAKYHYNLSINFPEKLTRPHALEAIRTHLAEQAVYVEKQKDLDDILSSEYVNRCVIITKDKMSIEVSNWLDVISVSDFFLCLPGDYIPMCHNAIEAMAVGTIPIINYPEWFKPHLKHMENCITFTDSDDLLEKIRTALEMEQEKIDEMRENVIRYYENYSNLGAFVNKLISSKEDKITVFVLSGMYKKHVHSFNKDSIIFDKRIPFEMLEGESDPKVSHNR